MSDLAFSFHGVSKHFGRVRALDGLDLEAPRGSVIGLVGRNGAGKSTALRLLVGLQRPGEGQVRLLGEDPWRMSVGTKARLGYMSERPLPFPSACASDLVGFCAGLYPRWDAEMCGTMLGRFDIDPRRKLSTLSMGQQRAVALMLALCPRPDVLVLDEPAANLDPVIRRQFLDEVLGLVAEEGRTVLFSSHNLGDVERVADRLAVLHEGRLLLHRPVEELKERVRRLRLIFPGAVPADLSKLVIPGLIQLRTAGHEALATVDGFGDDLPAALARATGARVEVQALALEDLFIDLVGHAPLARAA